MFPEYVYKRRPNGVRRKKRSNSVASATQSSSGSARPGSAGSGSGPARLEFGAGGRGSIRSSDSEASVLSPGYDSSASSTCSLGFRMSPPPAPPARTNDIFKATEDTAQWRWAVAPPQKGSIPPSIGNERKSLDYRPESGPVRSFNGLSNAAPLYSLTPARQPTWSSMDQRERSGSGSSYGSRFSSSPKLGIYSFARNSAREAYPQTAAADSDNINTRMASDCNAMAEHRSMADSFAQWTPPRPAFDQGSQNHSPQYRTGLDAASSRLESLPRASYPSAPYCLPTSARPPLLDPYAARSSLPRYASPPPKGTSIVSPTALNPAQPSPRTSSWRSMQGPAHPRDPSERRARPPAGRTTRGARSDKELVRMTQSFDSLVYTGTGRLRKTPLALDSSSASSQEPRPLNASLPLPSNDSQHGQEGGGQVPHQHTSPAATRGGPLALCAQFAESQAVDVPSHRERYEPAYPTEQE